MNSKKNLKRNLLICLLAGSAVMYTLPLHAATSVIGNGTLPSGGQFFDGNKFIQGTANENGNGFNFADIGSITKPNDLTMNVHQNNQNAVIKWDSFNVGGSATVNFTSDKSNFNTLNYVNGGNASQIYGTINAQGGNIFVVNPAGVQIGNSAQINVGSLYVSNKNLDNVDWKAINDVNPNINSIMGQGTTGDAALMSLGNINAGEVTFEGNGRIVIDSERLKDVAGDEKLNYQNINIKTSEKNKNNIIIGYEAYDETITNGSVVGYDNKNTDEVIATVTTENGTSQYKKANGYMWVEDVEQLQAIGKNANTLSGNYALRNSIDATSTANWNEVNGTYEGFNPIGLYETGKVIVNNNNEYGFTGNFDGLDYNIFGLTINRENEANVGLFGVAHNANINNVTLVGGSITGGSVVGSVVGAALGNTHITNATNSASVTGNTDVGGIVGYSGKEINGLVNNITTNAHFTNLINTGAVHSNGESDEQGGIVSNAGGLIGYMYNGTLDGNSYNLGNVSGDGYNVGGLVGYAVNSTIGDGTNLVYNRLDVTGAYNVGGIVGNMEGSTVKYAENSGTVLATGHSTEDYIYHTAITLQDNIPNGGRLDDAKDIAKVIVDVANVGGIAGTSAAKEGKASEITNVTNTGDVSSSKVAEQNYYAAGNVGGVVGRAEDTNITTATNRENDIRGAHNVGGIAGYFGSSKGDETGENVPRYTVTSGINDGGDIMATGARRNGNFVQELVRRVADGSNEKFTVGNIGGVVGYMDGYNVYVTGSANRGTVHTSEPADPKNVKDWEKAANVGGIVGKIDRSDTKELDKIKKNTSLAAVNNSYNTGDVLGYTGVGGVVGMMYNGEVAGSYNLGYISTTRQSTPGGSIDALNMGGVVGDTTENANAKGVVIYDVYNKGQIGDSEFNYYGRHVGGIVGRLSGTVEKAYNNGAIYNGYNVVGGIAGWMAQGKIENAFNTGNITVLNKNNAQSQVGGIVGAANVATESIEINNVYNLGTLRSFRADSNSGVNTLGGIIGQINEFKGNGQNTFTISNAYTTGNLMMYKLDDSGSYVEDLGGDQFEINGTNYISSIGSIYGLNTIGGDNDSLKVENTYYIRPQDKLVFKDLADQNVKKDNSNKPIYFNQKHLQGQYQYYDENDVYHSLTFTTQSGGDVDGGSNVAASDNNWRIYGGNTPILNAFLPKAEDYFDDKNLSNEGIGSIQYGTAYDPLLTIIKTNGQKDNLSYNWQDLGINNAAGIAVYGAGLTLDKVNTSSGSGYFGGTIYADGALNLNGGTNDIGLGSAADIYGSAVNITTDGKVTIYGDLTATGNGTTAENNPDTYGSGSITITASDVDVYGTLTSASNTQGANVTIPGIEDSAVTWTLGNIKDPYASMSDIADRFAHTTGASAVDGNITINANGTWNDADNDNIKDEGEVTGGNVNLYFGNKEQGLITTGGDLTVTGTGDVYVDSDLDIGGDLKLNGTGADSEVVLNITNIGEVQKKNDNTDADNSTKYLHDFLEHFANTTNNSISFGNTQDAKITVDMWENNKLNLDKFAADFTGKLNTLHITNANGKNAQQLTHIWVSNGDQLKGIQEAAKGNSDILGYNFALKGDINASHITDYEAIGGENGAFTGTFDGRGNRIIGLTVDKVNGQNTANAGIFSTVGEGGVVKDVNIYSGTFTGSKNAGTVAGKNNGRIEGIVTFGNTVTVTGEDGNAGGIVGVNTSGEFSVVDKETGSTNGGELTGGIYDVESTGSVIAGSSSAVAGGLVGRNDGGLANSFSDSAVTVKVDNQNPVTTTGGLGGVVGVNTEKGNVQYVDSLGVTNGGATNSSNIGGIIGTNNGNMYSGYNESIVSGKDNIGGIIGENSTGGTVTNIVNATSVTGENESADNVSQYVGGLVGSNSGSVTNGRNNGTITGTNYVGGMVGINGENSTLTNLVNDSSAAITGEQYVGGIAGSNSGTITADKANNNLINRGSITGYQYVGGVAGLNTGVITNTNNDVELYVNTSAGDEAKYFGGVVGQNGIVASTGTEANDGIIENATNTNKITAPDAAYVGGIVGWNTSEGKLIGMGNSNEGEVIGGSFVGGVIGKNDAAIGGKNAAQVGIKNEGIVIATQGGAGGLIGENNAAITNTVMTNKGEAHGNIANDGSGTGGLIGTNNENGDITYSSMINEVTGTVTGVNNVGGLIGVNKADITGGRENTDGTDAGMYINKIFNNGVIEVGSYTDADDDGKYEFAASNGQNIGGLFGNNSGTVKAAYNTGAINAGSSSNVGGIVGNNAGKLDQVFNTVMTGVDDKGNTVYGTITGKYNVGGLVGINSGTLSNAYNTTGVEGATNFGNAVGVNINKVENIYGYSELVGNGNEATNSYVINNSDEWKQQEKYIRFDFTTSDNTPAIWKNYDGYSNPLLKVFLTKAGYKGDEEFTYNATDQGLTINSTTITAADELDAYNNANSLLTATQNKNAGKDYLGIYSQQIAASGKGDTFDPNNLGYDIDVTYDIKKAQINISLDEINRVYGNAAISNNNQNSIKNEAGYGYSYEIANGEFNNTMKTELSNNGITFTQKTDGAVYGVNGNKVTNDAGDYTWSANFELKNDNYEFINGQENISYDGVSKVNRAEITVDLNEVIRDYGNTAIKNNGGNYTASINGLVNGDNELGYTSDDLNITVTSDGALTGNSSGKVTGDAGDHIWTAEVTGKDGQTLTNLSKNYNITVKNSGKSTVNKAQIQIDANSEAIQVGGTPDYTGTDINGELVNGDKLNGNYHYGVKDSADEKVVGDHSIGVWIGNTFYDLSETVDWTNVEGFFSNYEVTYNPGTLTVTEQVMPDLPDNWPNNRWDYLFDDNPFDRNENFRERKAEVNFVDGAMEI